MNSEEKCKLDRKEGKGKGYSEKEISLKCEEKEYECFTYLAESKFIVDNLKPYHWYKQMVILGARFLQFPDSYILQIEQIESMEDHDIERKKKNEKMIKQMVIENSQR